MTELEKTFENEIAVYLEGFFSDFLVEPCPAGLSKDEMRKMSETDLDGAIFISYTGSEFKRIKGSRINKRKLQFAAHIINKNRQTHSLILDNLTLLREKLYLFDYQGIRMNIIKDKILSNSTVEGFFTGVLFFESDFILPG